MISKEDLKFAAFQARKKVQASKLPIDPDFIRTESKKIKALKRRKKRQESDRTVQEALQTEPVPQPKPGLVNPNLIIFIVAWIVGVLYFFLQRS